jgi:hypothetical protein
MLSTAATKLLLWFNRYKTTAAEYYYRLDSKGITPRGVVFTGAFEELLGEYGYSNY